MAVHRQKLTLLGSTGSIGRSALDVVSGRPGQFDVVALTARSNLDTALSQAQRFKPRWLVAADETDAAQFDWSGLPNETELISGPDGIEKVASLPEIDTVIAAIVGSAGLRGTLAAVEAGKRVALANKETMVMAGSLVNEIAAERGATVMPVDSEHSAVFQALAAGRRQDVRRVILTASGGPFRQLTSRQMKNVTVAQALDHPTWDMGPKITIDSATMMNKALEIIEAHWLFDLEPDHIDVVIHPQSIVHSMVEYIDGSVVAQLSPPDMRLPIQFALSYPERWDGPAQRLDLTQSIHLDFEPPDFERFPAIPLGIEVAGAGGTAGVVVNAANEAAVDMFLAGHLQFTEIVLACRTVLENHDFDPSPKLEDLLRLDSWARQEISRWVCTS